jgi:hypothetical protein
MLDELLPEQLEWERLVRSYPVPALLVVAAGAFLLGYTRGTAIIGALSAAATAQLAETVGEALGR